MPESTKPKKKPAFGAHREKDFHSDSFKFKKGLVKTDDPVKESLSWLYCKNHQSPSLTDTMQQMYWDFVAEEERIREIQAKKMNFITVERGLDRRVELVVVDDAEFTALEKVQKDAERRKQQILTQFKRLSSPVEELCKKVGYEHYTLDSLKEYRAELDHHIAKLEDRKRSRLVLLLTSSRRRSEAEIAKDPEYIKFSKAIDDSIAETKKKLLILDVGLSEITKNDGKDQ